MQRRNFLVTLGGAAAGIAYAADAQQQVFDLFTKIASALSEGEAGAFIEAVDPAMPHFEEFKRDLTALISAADLANSIEVVNDKGDETHRDEELDWYLEIIEKAASHKVERRRDNVKFRLERKGKKWKIVSIAPLSFFGPAKTG